MMTNQFEMIQGPWNRVQSIHQTTRARAAMAPATEIAILPLAVGAKVEDTNSPSHAIWQSRLDTIASQGGYQRLYWGRKVEDQNVIWLLIGTSP